MELAWRYYVKRQKQDVIMDRMQFTTRQRAAAVCKALEGLVRVAVLPMGEAEEGRLDEAVNEQNRLKELADRVKARFGLKQCVLIRGRRELMQPVLSEEDKTAYWGIPPERARSRLELLADVAVKVVSERLVEMRKANVKPAIVFTFGVIARRIANNLIYTANIPREGVVLPAQGVRSLKEDRFDSNIIARDVSRPLGYTYYTLPIPARLEPDTAERLSRDRFLAPVLNALKGEGEGVAEVNMVVGKRPPHATRAGMRGPQPPFRT